MFSYFRTVSILFLICNVLRHHQVNIQLGLNCMHNVPKDLIQHRQHTIMI